MPPFIITGLAWGCESWPQLACAPPIVHQMITGLAWGCESWPQLACVPPIVHKMISRSLRESSLLHEEAALVPPRHLLDCKSMGPETE